jgi:hypothetical protein
MPPLIGQPSDQLLVAPSLSCKPDAGGLCEPFSRHLVHYDKPVWSRERKKPCRECFAHANDGTELDQSLA